MVCLGLWASRHHRPTPATPELCRRGAEWLLHLQAIDGSVGLSATLRQPRWVTAHALWLWNVLGLAAEARSRATAWLLGRRGNATANDDGIAQPVIGHDRLIVGWPWVEGTHSWVEPTAMAILALCQQGLNSHPRVREGCRLLLDRSVLQGGWNYGNRAVFGRDLRAQPGPTGLALMALAAQGEQDCSPIVRRGIDFLRATLPTLRAPLSLGWGVLGLRAWNSCPRETDAWLAESYAEHTGQADVAAGLGVLLLASGGMLSGPPQSAQEPVVPGETPR
jgi:hypothetical protein